MTPPGPVRFGMLAYGPSGRMHREAVVALLTISAYAPAGSEVIVLTDHPEQYRWLGESVTIDRLTPAILTEWQGPTGDRYRPKIETLRRLAADHAAHVVLADTDIMARRDLTPMVDRLAAGALLLHRREYALAAPPRKGDRSLPGEILGRAWQGITPGPDAAMWNGGIIASSRVHRGLYDRTLAVFDEMRTASRHFAVEQLTYSIVFPAYGPLEEAAPWFDHYWANREWFDQQVARFLADATQRGMTPDAARERLRHNPIVGPLDGRVPWWLTRLRRLVSAPPGVDDAL